MFNDGIICSETLKKLVDCHCSKCKKVLNIVNSFEDVPEEGTDQAAIFDEARAHLIFPPNPGESFDDIIKDAQK